MTKNGKKSVCNVLYQCDLQHVVTDFSKCDFSLITAHLNRIKEDKTHRTKAEKEADKLKKEEIEAKYAYATVDGVKEKVGNFRVEPPGLFRGRGEHPKMGMLKKRIVPEDITINIGADADVPMPPAGHRWKEIVSRNTVTWLAMWRESVNEGFKYVWLSATSRFKGESDMKKFEKARELKVLLVRIV